MPRDINTAQAMMLNEGHIGQGPAYANQYRATAKDTVAALVPDLGYHIDSRKDESFKSKDSRLDPAMAVCSGEITVTKANGHTTKVTAGTSHMIVACIKGDKGSCGNTGVCGQCD